MTEKNEIERRTDTMFSRWAKGKNTVPLLIALAACLVILGFFLGDAVCRP